MKFFAALVLLVAGVSALPEKIDQRNFIVDHILGRILEISERIRELGLDEVDIAAASGSFALPVPAIFSASGSIQNIKFNGLSNIVINQVSYDPVSSAVSFDLALPAVHASAGLAYGEVILFNNKLEGSVSGSFDISDVSVKGVVSVRVGLWGVVAESAYVEARLGGIQSAIQLNIGSRDVSEVLNNFINVIIPQKLDEFQRHVDELIAYYLVRFVNRD